MDTNDIFQKLNSDDKLRLVKTLLDITIDAYEVPWKLDESKHKILDAKGKTVFDGRSEYQSSVDAKGVKFMELIIKCAGEYREERGRWQML